MYEVMRKKYKVMGTCFEHAVFGWNYFRILPGCN